MFVSNQSTRISCQNLVAAVLRTLRYFVKCSSGASEYNLMKLADINLSLYMCTIPPDNAHTCDTWTNQIAAFDTPVVHNPVLMHYGSV